MNYIIQYAWLFSKLLWFIFNILFHSHLTLDFIDGVQIENFTNALKLEILSNRLANNNPSNLDSSSIIIVCDETVIIN